jgi:protein O-GlcNAc transferase
MQPENLEALHLMGIIGIQVQDMEIAKELLSKAAAIDPTIPLFYRKLDEDFGKPGLYAETLRCFRSALETDSATPVLPEIGGKNPWKPA